MGQLSLADFSTEWTGDPFVDTGGLVVERLKSRFPEKTLFQLVKFVTDVYLCSWKGKLHSIFHTTSKLLTPSTKGKHRENTLEYFYNIIFKKEYFIEDSCKICTKFDKLYLNSREFFPLSGSGAFVNFHHAHEDGIYLCGKCTLKLYFVPLGVVQIGKYIGLLQIQSVFTRRFVAREIIDTNLDKLAKTISDGILQSEYKNPRNALFGFATKIIRMADDEEASETLQLFHFTNFGAEPYCNLYTLPSPVFRFLNKVIHHQPEAWYNFVKRYYRVTKASWDWDTQDWIMQEKYAHVKVDEGEYLNNFNVIYERLLSGQSILKHILSMHKEYFLQQKEPFPLEIAIHYVTEVLHMDKKQLELIKRIGDAVFDLARKENNFKKYLFLLEGASRAYQLRGALLKVIKERYKNGEAEPLIRLDEYVDYLFPDGQSWGEVRDLMLIYLYERLHENNIASAEIPEDISPIDDEINETF